MNLSSPRSCRHVRLEIVCQQLKQVSGRALTLTDVVTPVWILHHRELFLVGNVQSFSDGKLGPDRKRISATGGRFPVWRRDGSELFFIAQDAQLMSTSVKTSGTEFSFETPKPLFKTRMMNWNLNFHELDISPDGQRFLIGTVIGEPTSPPPTVILNWAAALKK